MKNTCISLSSVRASLCPVGKSYWLRFSKVVLIRARAAKLLRRTLRVAQAQIYAGLGNTEHIVKDAVAGMVNGYSGVQ